MQLIERGFDFSEQASLEVSSEEFGIADRYLGVVSEFRDNVERPRDPYMEAFYRSALIQAYRNPEFIDVVQNVLKSREITSNHFANLLLRGVQYIELNQLQRTNYPEGMDNSDNWSKELELILREHKELLLDILHTKHTTTTIYQRYAGAKAIMVALSPKRAIKAADFGCGGNYGLPGIALDESFKLPSDKTCNKEVQMLLQEPLGIQAGLAIDIEDPYDDETRKWRHACLYPGELKNFSQIVKLEDHLKAANQVRFLKADLLNLFDSTSISEMPLGELDAVFISTICYQMTQEQREKLFKNAKLLLNRDGIIIVQDFARKNQKNPKDLDFAVSWTEPFSYRNFIASAATSWEMKEILRWRNGRCEEVQEGEDFSLIIPLTPPSSDSLAA